MCQSSSYISASGNAVCNLFFLDESVKSSIYIYTHTHTHTHTQGESLARGPKLLSMYTVEQHGFLVHKYWQTSSFKACQTAFRTEFGERRAPSKCSVQKLIKKLETRGSQSNTSRRLSLGPIEGQSVQKYTLHNRTTHRYYTPRDSSRQRRHFGKSIPAFGETHSMCLDVKGDQFQQVLFLHRSWYMYIDFQVIISVT